MSKKHFIQIAKNISEIADPVARRRQAELMAQLCASSNPRFNFERFYTACGVRNNSEPVEA